MKENEQKIKELQSCLKSLLNFINEEELDAALEYTDMKNPVEVAKNLLKED